MRFVVGVNGKSSSGSSLSIVPPRDRLVVGMMELLPDGLSSLEGVANILSSQNAATRFLSVGEAATASLGEPRSWPVIEEMLSLGDVRGILIYEDPGEFIARIIAQGGGLSDAASEWTDRSKQLLKVATKHFSSVDVFSGGGLRNAPKEFEFFFENQFGSQFGVDFNPPPPAGELTIANAYAGASAEISDLNDELAALARPTGLYKPQTPMFPGVALDELREARKNEVYREELKRYTAVLKSQLVIAQSKAEISYRTAKRSGAPSADSVANKAALGHARAEIAALRNSVSWKFSAPIRVVSRIVRGGFGLRRLISERRQRSIVKKSGLFDEAWYIERYTDIVSSGLAPLVHFVRFGGAEGRSPSKDFNSSDYLKSNPDVAAAGANPLVHYLAVGRAEGRTAENHS